MRESPSMSALAMCVLMAGCATPPHSEPPPPGSPAAEPSQPEPPGVGEVLPPSPWAGDALAPGDVPPAYLAEWGNAENRASCAPIAPAALGDAGEGATPRAANFSGGWAVAYDLPRLRSAFGVAGTGVSAGDPTYHEWPYSRRWADGSLAEYGPEGGTGPNQLAYLRVAGQQCLYNVWSRLGREHLEYLLEQLRFVQAATP